MAGEDVVDKHRNGFSCTHKKQPQVITRNNTKINLPRAITVESDKGTGIMMLIKHEINGGILAVFIAA